MISRKEVQHIAKLARLGLTPKEVKKFQRELSSILDYIKKLKKVDIKGVEPTTHTRALENVVREDRAKSQSISVVQGLVRAAPHKKGRYIKIKAIL